MYAKAVIKDINVARRISAERSVATASRYLHVRSLKKESRVGPATETLEVARVSKNIRNKLEGKTVCEKVRNYTACNACVTKKNDECFKPFCGNCRQNKEINHLCYMEPLKNEVPSADNVLFIFFDFETSQDTKISETAKLHVPILVCFQQFCTACEMQDDYEQDCARCGKRQHSFFEDPVDDLLSYLCEPCPWCKKVAIIAHNAKAFDSLFILNRAIFLKWTPELILNGLKIV